MGILWGFWLVARWGAWEALGLMGRLGWELRCSKLSQGWNVVNKDPFLPALMVGSFTEAARGWAPVCSVTHTHTTILHRI